MGHGLWANLQKSRNAELDLRDSSNTNLRDFENCTLRKALADRLCIADRPDAPTVLTNTASAETEVVGETHFPRLACIWTACAEQEGGTREAEVGVLLTLNACRRAFAAIRSCSSHTASPFGERVLATWRTSSRGGLASDETAGHRKGCRQR
eukprot:6186185-Pleurochrysis_carterae.AAC.4